MTNKIGSITFRAACDSKYIGSFATDVEAYNARRKYQRNNGLPVDPPANQVLDLPRSFSSTTTGVSYHKATGRWTAKHLGKYLKIHDTEALAAKAVEDYKQSLQ